MKSFRDKPIRNKINIVIIASCTLLTSLVSAAFIMQDLLSHSKAIESELIAIANITATNSAAALAFRDENAANETLRALQARNNIVSATLYLPDNRLFTTFNPQREALLESEASHHQTLTYPGECGQPLHQAEFILVCEPILLDEERIGTLVVVANYNEVNRYALESIAIATLILAAAVAMAIWFSSRISLVISKPITSLGEAIQQVRDTRTYSLRAPITSGDEVGKLTEQFNDMLLQIQIRDDTLRDYSTQLETLVQRRTLELSDTIEKLKIAKETEASASRAKSEFLSRMSHELRTPLNAIIGFSQLLTTDTVDKLSPNHSESVQEILRAGYHLLELINEVLDLARIESNKLALSIQKVPAMACINDCIALIKPLADSRSITITNDISIDNQLSVFADPVRVRQILINLLSNAVKYNRPKGKILLSSEPIDNNQLRLYVADTGKGISPDQIAKLFEPFERLDADPEVEGTGIGLVVSKRLAEAMGGTIGLQSKINEGSVFWVDLKLPATHDLSQLQDA